MRATALSSESHRRSAFLTMVSKTGWRSAGELEMTRRSSPVAACWARASARRASEVGPAAGAPGGIRCAAGLGWTRAFLAPPFGLELRRIAPPGTWAQPRERESGRPRLSERARLHTRKAAAGRLTRPRPAPILDGHEPRYQRPTHALRRGPRS